MQRSEEEDRIEMNRMNDQLKQAEIEGKDKLYK